MFDWPQDIMHSAPEYFAEIQDAHNLPTQTGGQLVGIMTLNE